MSDKPEPQNETTAEKKDWQIAVKWLNTSGFRILMIAAGLLTVALILFVVLVIKDSNTGANVFIAGILTILTIVVTTISAVSNRLMVEVMDRQETEMTNQRKIARSQWQTMLDTIEQTDKMFYASNRAYIGVQGIAVYDALTGEQRFPPHGNFYVIAEIVNSGKTPALNARNVFRGSFTGREVPPEQWEVPDLQEVESGRLVAQILPDQSSPIIGDPIQVTEDMATAVLNGEIIFAISTKIDFNCLDIKDESFITHHVWDHRLNHFAESGTWPPDVRFAELGLNWEDVNQGHANEGGENPN